MNNKSRILVGIYFSNSLLTNNTQLTKLDTYLQWHIKRYIKKTEHKKKLLKYSFVDGFNNKIFVSFNNQQFTHIVKIWKNL